MPNINPVSIRVSAAASHHSQAHMYSGSGLQTLLDRSLNRLGVRRARWALAAKLAKGMGHGTCRLLHRGSFS